MSDNPPKKEKIPVESNGNAQPPSKEVVKQNRIIILRERNIPFEKERPPNFSPNYFVTVHRIRKNCEAEEQKE